MTRSTENTENQDVGMGILDPPSRSPSPPDLAQWGKDRCPFCMRRLQQARRHPEEQRDKYPTWMSDEEVLNDVIYNITTGTCVVLVTIFGKNEGLCSAQKAQLFYSQIAARMQHNLQLIKKHGLDDDDVDRPSYTLPSLEDVANGKFLADNYETLNRMGAMDECAMRHISLKESWEHRPLARAESYTHKDLLDALHSVEFYEDRNVFAHEYMRLPRYPTVDNAGVTFRNIAQQYEHVLELLRKLLLEILTGIEEGKNRASTGPST